MPAVGRLSQEKIEEIRRLRREGETFSSISRALDVKRSTAAKYCADIDAEMEKIDVVCEGKVLTYRENLNWAMEMAGEFARTKVHPETCPNNSAWFLYQQALAEPKDFMAKIGQIESKAVTEDNGENVKRGSKKTLEEIESFLAGMDEREHETTQV